MRARCSYCQPCHQSLTRALSQELYVVVMEYLTEENVSLLDTVDDVSVWTDADIKVNSLLFPPPFHPHSPLSSQVVLRDLAHIHSLHLSRSDWLSSRPWLERVTGQRMAHMTPLWRELMIHAHNEFPQFWTQQRYIQRDQLYHSLLLYTISFPEWLLLIELLIVSLTSGL